jgi:hypothetical protein
MGRWMSVLLHMCIPIDRQIKFLKLDGNKEKVEGERWPGIDKSKSKSANINIVIQPAATPSQRRCKTRHANHDMQIGRVKGRR